MEKQDRKKTQHIKSTNGQKKPNNKSNDQNQEGVYFVSAFKNKQIDKKNQMKRLQELSFMIRFRKYASVFFQFARLRMEKLLNQKQTEMINDKSYFKNEDNKANLAKKYRIISEKTKIYSVVYNEQIVLQKQNKNSFLECYFRKIPVFLPDSTFIEIWQALKIFASLICFFCYFICFSFGTQLNELFRLILFLDMLVHSNTGVYVKGILSTNRKTIFKHYKESRALLYDFISQLFPFFYFILTGDKRQSRIASSMLLFIVFKYKDINIIINQMKDKFLLDKKAQNIIELFSLFKNILLISHIFACFWILAAKYSQYFYYEQNDQVGNPSNPLTWMDLMSLSNQPWHVQYIYSYYFITVTTITVGYGDIRPTNIIEILASILLMMTCCLVFGFTLNSIGQIFQDFYLIENQIRQKRFIIGNYMMRKGVSKSTMKEIYQYLDYYWKEKSDENQQEEQEIISQLSNRLKEDLLTESYHNIFKQNSIFKDNFSYSTIQKCLPFIQEQRCTPEEIIYDAEIKQQDIYIYFVLQGELEVYVQSFQSLSKNQPLTKTSTSTIITLRKGDHFGESSFFSGEQSKMSLKSLSFSKLIKIKRSDFLRILMDDQVEQETFCMIKDMILFSKNGTRLRVKCISCRNEKHEVADCPFLHLNVNKNKLIGQMSYSQPHQNRERPKFERNLKSKSNSLKLIDSCSNYLLEFLNDKYDNLIKYEENNLQLYSLNSQAYSSSQNDPVSINQQDKYGNSSYNSFDLNQNTYQLSLNSNQNITNSNRQSLISTPQLIYQNSSYQHQLSVDQKLKPIESLKSQNLTTFRTESEDWLDSINKNEDFQEQEKVKQISANGKRPSYFSSFQQFQNNFSRTCSIQTQENNQQIQQFVARQAAAHQQNTILNDAKRKNSQLLPVKQFNRNQNYKKMTKLVTRIPTQIIDDFIKNKQEQKLNRIEFQAELFDLFQGDFEKMKIMVNYFSAFNFSKILNKIILIQNSKNQKCCKNSDTSKSRKLQNKKKDLNNSLNVLESQKIQNNMSNSINKKCFTSSNNKIITQSIFKQQVKDEKPLFQLNYSLLESKQIDQSQNVEKFITQESHDCSFSKISPNTPTNNSLDIKNFQNATQNRKFYDFQ